MSNFVIDFEEGNPIENENENLLESLAYDLNSASKKELNPDGLSHNSKKIKKIETFKIPIELTFENTEHALRKQKTSEFELEDKLIVNEKALVDRPHNTTDQMDIEKETLASIANSSLDCARKLPEISWQESTSKDSSSQQATGKCDGTGVMEEAKQVENKRKSKPDNDSNENNEDLSEESGNTESDDRTSSEEDKDDEPEKEVQTKQIEQNSNEKPQVTGEKRKKLTKEEKRERQRERYQKKIKILSSNESGIARFFNRIFDSTVAKSIAGWINTNRKIIPEKKDRHPMRRKWRDLSELEFRRFIGILFFIGVIKKPSLREYWRVEPSIDAAEEPSIRKLMNRDRFEQILSSFPESSEGYQLKSNEGEQARAESKPKSKVKNSDGIAVICELCASILENSRKNYSFSKVVTLDSSKIVLGAASTPMAGKQPAQLKPFIFYEAKTGFVVNCVMSKSEATESRQATIETALKLLLPHKSDELSVFIASSYASNQLLAELLKHNIKACGKISLKDIDAPESFHKELNDLPAVVSRQYIIDNQTMGLWKSGKKVFCLVSTIHIPLNTNKIANPNQLLIEETSPFVTLKDRLTLDEMAADYSTNVGVGNRFEEKMLKFANTPALRGRKLLLGILYYFLEIAMVNSYLMYLESEKGKGKFMTQKEYRIHVIENLSRNARRLTLIRNVKKSKESVQLEKIQLLSRSGRCFLVPNGAPAVCKICCSRPSVKKIKSSYKCHPCQLSVCAVGCYDSHRLFIESQKFVFK